MSPMTLARFWALAESTEGTGAGLGTGLDVGLDTTLDVGFVDAVPCKTAGSVVLRGWLSGPSISSGCETSKSACVRGLLANTKVNLV